MKLLNKILSKIENSRAWARYLQAPKRIQVSLYVVLIAVGFIIGIGLGVLTTTVKSYGTNMYTHYQMTEYGVIDVTDKTPKLPEWLTKSFEADGFEIVIRPDNDYLQSEAGEYVAAYFSAPEKLIVMRKDYDGFVPYHEMGHYYDWKYDWLSCSTTFQAIYEAEADDYCLARQYYAQTSSKEYFASCFAMYFMYPNDLERVCPLTYKYMDSLDLHE